MEVVDGSVAASGKPEECVVQERQRLCSEFAAITGRSCGVAQCYLAENEWQMERALNSYFESAVDEGAMDARPRTPPPAPAPVAGVCVDLTNEPAINVTNTGVNIENCVQKEDDSTFSLITWNIDGLDIHNLQDRAKGVCEYLALYTPDVVFLQEVIPPYYSYLKKKATSYTTISGNEDGYFTVVMLKKSRVKLISHEIIPFPTTQMMRNLLCVHVTICGNELCLLNSHFESTRNHARERMNQLKMMLKKMQEIPESVTVIFGGDTNLRDHEVSKSGGLPEKILDVWEFLGKPEHCRYTWDTQANTNLAIEATCKLRFDRIFFRPAADGCNIVPRSLDLIGLEKLECGRFPSDHWGLLCGFDIIL
ncbi:tyrosyl-DNA phosphodiesterase 2 isoform X2 [Dromiciops gliroides]|uniref:tyrosyl-DNA phosphodiesterase 2 isoform X2 n=1 Tax=Dromiciops gliroides TaxID=33562 RepID=UPI001CC708D7|nr:tyrosyl-DNA phosphodiesterase 2 isoform X2 [Dromiciops gliroides]